MRSNAIKGAFFASLIILSMSCFIYVNSAPIDNALTVETMSRSTQSDEEKANKGTNMLDLALVKGIVNVVQKFLPAK
ncbi:MAG: hypothetical protein JNL70_27040 [Saprospiraceae bacterium]|nr:hypothetical protein [Saprospiraceae bacterium]